MGVAALGEQVADRFEALGVHHADGGARVHKHGVGQRPRLEGRHDLVGLVAVRVARDLYVHVVGGGPFQDALFQDVVRFRGIGVPHPELEFGVLFNPSLVLAGCGLRLAAAEELRGDQPSPQRGSRAQEISTTHPVFAGHFASS